MGKERQLLCLTIASIGLNLKAAIRYKNRTGIDIDIDIFAPPGPLTSAA